MYGWGKGAASHTILVVSLLDPGKAWSAQSQSGGISSRVSISHRLPVSIDILDLVP